MSKKILVLGVGQTNFLSFLYSTLKKFDQLIIISAPKLVDLDKTVNHPKWMYENDQIKESISFLSYIRACFYIMLSGHIFQTLIFILFIEHKIKKAIHFIFKSIKEKAYFIQNRNFRDYDTFHFHFLQYSYLRELFYVPRNKKIVCTFWGSDLLRTSDSFNHYFVKKALNRSTIITCQSIEMREIILAKYGRNLYDKITIAQFPPRVQTFQQISEYNNNSKLLKEFKTKYKYNLNKFNVLIGHNGSPFNQHLNICKSLEILKNKEKIHVIINLNYAINQSERSEYKRKLSAILINSGITFTILEEYYNHTELSISRLASDIFIHLPISDALSGTMLELLYAGNIVITGSWLPYKTYRNIGLNYYEVSQINELPYELDTIINNIEKLKTNTDSNKAPIENYFLGNSIAQRWHDILI